MKKLMCLLCLHLAMVSPFTYAKESLLTEVVQVVWSEVSDKEEYSKSINIKKNNLIDGTTSASQLRAKKSHSVSEQDGTMLTVFLGLFAIGFIVFLVSILTVKK